MAFRISMSPSPDGVFVSTPRIVGWTERTYRLYCGVKWLRKQCENNKKKSTHCGPGRQGHHMSTQIWVDICSDNGLLPEGTKSLPEPTLTYHQCCTMIFTWVQFHKRYLNHQSHTKKKKRSMQSHWTAFVKMHKNALLSHGILIGIFFLALWSHIVQCKFLHAILYNNIPSCNKPVSQ